MRTHPTRRTLRPSLAIHLAAAWLAAALALFAPAAAAERVKDLANLAGARTNQLIGYGLVVGLDGTGDQTTQTPFTTQSLQSMLSQLGVNLPPGQSLQLKNVAAVMVTAQLPPYVQPGQLLDVTVSSMGNAKSLRGGTLLMTPLKGANGQIYAMAQGNVAIAGAGASAGGSKTQVNQLNAGRIPGGATVERSVPTALGSGDFVQIELKDADFGVARSMVDAINRRFGTGSAAAADGRVIRVKAPQGSDERVAFIAELENVGVDVAIPAARIVINARTGSIVMNRAVTLDECAVAHGNLTVTIQSDPVISQPAPFSKGETVVTERAQIDVKQEGKNLVSLAPGAKLADVVRALNTLGANPQDLLAILQAMKSSGALKADIEVI
ncbi:MAG: flagellar basal body P-ring protein FlgI [Burkholderiales bacterium]|nr:flagellar basal body P-ring protein FlgI [Burkholderiales bacterium]